MELKNTLEMISKQTSEENMAKIEEVFKECNGDAFATIFKLMEMDIPPIRGEKLLHERTVFDDVRMICDEKDTIFQNKLKST